MLLLHVPIDQFVSSDPAFLCHLAPKDRKLGKRPQMWIPSVWADVVPEHCKWRTCHGCSSAALWLLTDLPSGATINQCSVKNSSGAAFKYFKTTQRYPKVKVPLPIHVLSITIDRNLLFLWRHSEGTQTHQCQRWSSWSKWVQLFYNLLTVLNPGLLCIDYIWVYKTRGKKAGTCQEK